MLPRLFFALDLVQSGVIEQRLVANLANQAIRMARPALLRGGTSTSLEEDGTEVAYRLMDGIEIAEHLPELSALYETSLTSIASRVSGLDLMPSPEVQNGINLNVVDGGDRYEWHVDSNPVTGLLVLSHCDAERGGRLLFDREVTTQTALSLRPGYFLVFDATSAPHAVEPVVSHISRVTAPMNFFVVGDMSDRPSDLDSSLYGDV